VCPGFRAVSFARAREANLKVWLATITPASDAIVDGTPIAPDSERDRQTIDERIRTQTVADGYVDFDAAVRTPTNPAVLDDRLSSVDRRQLSPAGYERLAATVVKFHDGNPFTASAPEVRFGSHRDAMATRTFRSVIRAGSVPEEHARSPPGYDPDAVRKSVGVGR
jgi:hypothetical protein